MSNYIRAYVLTIYPNGYYNEIDVSGLLGPVPAFDTLLVQRNDPDGSVNTIRDGDNVVTNGVDEMVVFDYEAPLNASVTYTVTAIRHDIGGGTTTETQTAGLSGGPAVFTDNFESGVGNWTQISGTLLTSDGTVSHLGTKSAKLDPNGSGGTKGMTLNAAQPVMAGSSYDFVLFVRPNSLDILNNMTQASLQVTWKNSGGSTISTDSNISQGNSVNLSAESVIQWQPVKLVSVAPAGAVTVAIQFTYANANNAPTHYVSADDFTLSPSIVPGDVTLPFDTETVMVKSLANPSLSMEMWLVSMDSPNYPVRQQINPIIGGKFPIVISDVMGARTGTLTFATQTLDERRNFIQLFEQGATLLFQGDSDPYNGDGFEDMYFLCGNIAEIRPGGNSRDPIREWTVPYTEVASPSGALTSIPGNSWLLVTNFGTWQNVLTNRTSWLDVLNTPFS